MMNVKPQTAVEEKSCETFDDFAKGLWHQLKSIPPKSKLTVEYVTNAHGEIHNHRVITSEDRGPLTLR